MINKEIYSLVPGDIVYLYGDVTGLKFVGVRRLPGEETEWLLYCPLCSCIEYYNEYELDSCEVLRISVACEEFQL